MDELTDDDFEKNLDAEGELFTHYTIDDAEVVQNGLYNFLKNLNNNWEGVWLWKIHPVNSLRVWQ